MGSVRYGLPSVAAIALLGAGLLVSILLVPSGAQTTSIIRTTGPGDLGTIVTPAGTIHTITGGKRPGGGTNLFHSFGQFTVGTGDTANFLNNTNTLTTNILSRVTGNSPSNILGTIQTTGFPGAHLFLMNPAGVVFGPTAQLNVEGSFHVTTADYLRLADGVRFTAVAGAQDALLTAAPVAAFGFLNPRTSANSIQGSSLAVAAGNTFSYIVGDFSMEGGRIAASGLVNLVSVSSPGEVLFPTMEFPQNNLGGTITLSQGALIDAGGDPGGTVVIRGGRLVVDDDSLISADQLGDPTGPAIAVDIRAEDVSVTSGGRIGTAAFGFGNVGLIRIITDTLRVTGGGFVGSFGGGIGNSGNVNIQARSGVEVTNNGFIGTQVDSPGVGRGGDVSISSPIITVSTGGRIGSDSFTTGNGGDVRILADTLRVTDDGSIGSFGRGAGNSGNVNIQAGSGVEVTNNGFIGTQVDPTGVGSGGDVSITTPSITISTAGGIGSQTFGSGSSGNLRIATGSLEVGGGGRIGSESQGAGTAGNVNIFATGVVSITGAGSMLFTGATADGSAGDVTLSAQGSLSLADGAQIVATATAGGRGGNVELNVENLTLSRSAQISSKSTGVGITGSINIIAADQLVMTDSTVTTEAGLADGGDISLRADNLIHLTNTTVSSSVGFNTPAIGGNIFIGSQSLGLQNSRILAIAFAGPGGNINIEAGVFLVDALSVINASSSIGVSSSPISNLSGSLAPLPQLFVPTAALLLTSRCAARPGGLASSFVVAGRDAIPMEPGGLLPSPLSDLRPHLSVAESSAAEALSVTALAAGLTADLVQGCGS